MWKESLSQKALEAQLLAVLQLQFFVSFLFVAMLIENLMPG